MAKFTFSFSELLANPIKIMAAIYPYFLVVIIGMGFFYIDHTNAIVQNTVPPKLADSVQEVTDLPIADEKIASAVDMKLFSEPTPELIAKGKELFQSTCSSCHGAEGKGDGAAGVALNPKPRNFHAADGWKNGRKVTEIYNTVQKGIAASGMPGFDYLPPTDRLAIIQFIRTWMTDPPKDSPVDISALDGQYGLSAGTKVPGTVPIANAEVFYQKANGNKITVVNAALSKIAVAQETNSSAKLFFDITTNQKKALITLANSSEWTKGEKEFIAVVADNLNENGFSGKIFSLSSDEIANLIFYLKGVTV